MANPTDRPKKTLKERVDEIMQDMLDVLESLISPQPALIPVPARGRRQPYPYPR